MVYSRVPRLVDGSRFYPKDKDLRQRALHLFSDRSQWWLPGAAGLSDSEHESVVVYRIHIDHMTGRRTTRSEKA